MSSSTITQIVTLAFSALICVSHSQSTWGNSAMVTAHNNRRCLHGSPNLAWNEAAAVSMRDTLARSCVMQHQGAGGYGENLWSGNYLPSADGVLRGWYDEERASQGGHFTQVVWKSTTSVGCAICQRSDGWYVVGCRYAPAGNVVGQYASNVPAQIRSTCTAGGSTGGSTGGSSCQRVWGYTPVANLDRYGADIRNAGALAPSTLAGQCNGLANCRAFNSGGWLKTEYTPLTAYQGTCLYIKGCPGISGYNVYAYTDAPGNDIANSGTADVLSTANQCSARSNCVAFNSDGWMKYSSSGRTSNGGYCLYVKAAARREATGETSLLETAQLEEPSLSYSTGTIGLYGSLAAFVACGLAASSFLVYKKVSSAASSTAPVVLSDVTTVDQEMDVNSSDCQCGSAAAPMAELSMPLDAEHDAALLAVSSA